MGNAQGHVLSVNVGRAREFDYEGQRTASAIWKSPVTGRVAAKGVNLEGDEQADRAVHGGPDKAVYAYAIERMDDRRFLRQFTEAGRPGTYLRIVVEGELGAGDGIEVVERPDHDLSIGDIFRIYTRDRDEAERFLSVPAMSAGWKQWADVWVRRSRGRSLQPADPGCC